MARNVAATSSRVSDFTESHAGLGLGSAPSSSPRGPPASPRLGLRTLASSSSLSRVRTRSRCRAAPYQRVARGLRKGRPPREVRGFSRYGQGARFHHSVCFDAHLTARPGFNTSSAVCTCKKKGKVCEHERDARKTTCLVRTSQSESETELSSCKAFQHFLWYLRVGQSSCVCLPFTRALPIGTSFRKHSWQYPGFISPLGNIIPLDRK